MSLLKHPSCETKRKSHSSIRTFLSHHIPTDKQLSRSQEPFQHRLPYPIQLVNRKRDTVHSKKRPKLFQLYIGNKLKSQLERYFGFLALVNYSHRCTYKKEANPKYKVYVGKGNNSRLVKNVFGNRFWWEVTAEQEEANLIWTQKCHRPIFQQMRSGVGAPPSTCRLYLSPSQRMRDDMLILPEHERRRLRYPKEEEVRMGRRVRVTCNHIEHHSVLTKKKHLYHSLQAYLTEAELASIVPLTFHIQSTAELEPLFQYEGSKKRKGMWIVKPGENTNRGCGIEIIKTVNNISKYIQRQEKRHPQRTYIVQKYIMPFLFQKRKFDIRCFVLVTATPQISAYFYCDGYIRTSSFEFSPGNCGNKYIHLTNDAVQKKAVEYSKYECGNKITFQQFQNYLNLVHCNKKYSFSGQILPRLKEMARVSIEAANDFENSAKDVSFEILGYDFMIDQHFTPWLIEVNTNPCLETGCPVLDDIIPSMLQNAMKIAVDPLMPPPKLEKWPANEFFTCPLQLLQHNKFQLIYAQNI